MMQTWLKEEQIVEKEFDLMETQNQINDFTEQLNDRIDQFNEKIEIMSEIIMLTEKINVSLRQGIASMRKVNASSFENKFMRRKEISEKVKSETTENCNIRGVHCFRKNHISLNLDFSTRLAENIQHGLMTLKDHRTNFSYHNTFLELMEKHNKLDERLTVLIKEDHELSKTFSELSTPSHEEEAFAHIENNKMKMTKKNTITKLKDFLKSFPNHLDARKLLKELLGDEEIEEEEEEQKKSPPRKKNTKKAKPTITIPVAKRPSPFHVAPVASSSRRISDEEDVIVIEDIIPKKEEYDDDAPDEFCCPITFVLMTDPVLCSDGFTYERQAIEEWMINNPTSPLTRTPIFILGPDEEKKKLIELWNKKTF
jgi:hypothetical protein